MKTTILAIESSCDDTSAAVIHNGIVKSNCIASQKIHERYGGVVPELASRSHQQNIVPVVHQALSDAGTSISDIDAVACTVGPGLLGSLLVGVSFAKGFALAHECKLIGVNHLHAHVLASFIETETYKPPKPQFPFICLLVSGGNTQIILAHDYNRMEIIGATIDDAAGEAFDKCAKLLGLPYPGGPHIDRLAQQGNPYAFAFNKPQIAGYDYSFSGFKTSVLYFLQKEIAKNPDFIQQNLSDLCASIQHCIVEMLMHKLRKAVKKTGVKHLTIGGGVAANSGLRNTIQAFGEQNAIATYLPPLVYTTDNAAMIAVAAYHKYIEKRVCSQTMKPQARYSLDKYFREFDN
ncbi:MAG: tRNA (adenosine(37)-N6)-threonylcarbamoyltransferase complex transferase subunit TsaD [Bacteroidales bacterium]|jgi:N6-L-threonylcarbamoyladenine synthase|nr:tRNA (adenosine(37)-N6)-threonylcarbamoyltransferase complex transferase subunit TsaD [Bacteroidales bacterium]